MSFLKQKSSKKVILIPILLLAAFLRFYNVSSVPVSLYWDEVASTYNAYSISLTGKDEYGISHPLLFKSFLDYKTPANIYLTSIVTKIFGLNEFSARFTSAFLGTMTVFLTFFLIREMLKNRSPGFDSQNLALITSFLLAISPWHIQFSRTGFEANVGLFFVVAAIWSFFLFVNTNKIKFYFFSMFIFAASIYFYRSIWVFVPLMMLALVLSYKKLLIKENKKGFMMGVLFFLITMVPFLPSALSKEGFTRQAQVNIFTNSGERVYRAAVKQLQSGNTLLSKIEFNRRIVYAETIAQDYIFHFGPNFLFIQGDGNPRHGAVNMGLMYLWELPFLLIGLFALSRLKSDIKRIIIAWILIAPIPAALSVPAPHALRSLNILPMPQLVVAMGIFTFFYYLDKKYRKVFILFLSVFIISFFARYIYLYYIVTPSYSASAWGDGYKQLTQYVFANQSGYDKVLVSGHYWQPYIYFLFYKKYDPAMYQKFGSKKGFDKYIFGETSWDMNGKELGDQNLEKLAGTKNVLTALSPIEYSMQLNNVNKISEIKNHNNEIVFILATIK